jgi:hypothetical protein
VSTTPVLQKILGVQIFYNTGIGTDYPEHFLDHPIEMQRNVLVNTF